MFNSANVPAIRSTSPTSDRLALYDWNVSFDLTSLRTKSTRFHSASRLFAPIPVGA